MKKLLLLTGALALSIATMAQVAVQPKWDFTLERMMQSQTATRSTGSELTSVRIEVTDAEAKLKKAIEKQVEKEVKRGAKGK